MLLAPQFKPSALASFPHLVEGLLVDLDAAKGITLNGSDVAAWADQSGNLNHVAQSSASLQPVYTAANPHFRGKPSVDFHKSAGEYLFGASLPICTALSGSDKPMEVFAVVRKGTKVTTAEEMLWALGNSGSGTQSYLAAGWWDFSDDRQLLRYRIRDDAGTAESLPRENSRDLTDLDPRVICFSLSGAAAAAYVVGGTLNPQQDVRTDAMEVTADYSAQGAITFDRFAVGAFLRSTATLPGTFDLARLLVYDRVLSAAERAKIAHHLWTLYVAQRISAPTDLNGCSHWWDGDQLAGDAGTDVDTWEDQVGSLDFSASGFDAPVVGLHGNGRKTVAFQGTDDALDSAAASDGNFLHNGSSATLAVVYRVEAADTALQPILDTNGGSTTARGFSLAHDGASGAHSLQLKIGNGATNVVNHDSQDYGVRPGAWHVAICVHQQTVPTIEENYHLWIDGEHYLAVDAANAESASDAAGAITLGKLAGVGTYGKLQIGEIVTFSRALGSPGEVVLLGEYLARKWNAPWASIVAGNGLADTLNDATPHRGFGAACQDLDGVWHAIYRRGADHGSSRGVGVHVMSVDGREWTDERVIYDVDDADGRDFRGECGFVCLQTGPHRGRLVITSKWSSDTSNIYVAGQRSTLLVGYSDDGGGTWTWLDPVASDADLANWNYTASPNGLVELQTGPYVGRLLFTFTTNSTDTPGGSTTNQDVRLVYSDDGGRTWSQSTIIVTHDVELGTNKRATETHFVEFADGELLISIRNDTDQEIWLGHSTSTNPLVWTIDGAKAFDGYGRPVMAIDPADPDGLFIFYRDDVGALTHWRSSSDRGANWSAKRAFSNLHATTGVLGGSYAAMSYVFPAFDRDGNLWTLFGLEDNGTSDLFMRRWADAPVS